MNGSGKQKEKLIIWKLHIKYPIPSSPGICTIPSQVSVQVASSPLGLCGSEQNSVVPAHISRPHSVSGRPGLEGLLRPSRQSASEETGSYLRDQLAHLSASYLPMVPKQ